MDYTQLTDDELRRKVLELMGYSVEYETEVVDDYGSETSYYSLYLNGEHVDSAHYCNDAWDCAPHPLTDANVYMGLVDEIGKFGYSVSIRATYQRFVSAYLGTTRLIYSRNQNIGRAICEVYCQVKERK